MVHPSAFVLVPSVVAFLTFLLLSYRHDGASFREGPNLTLAVVCVLTMFTYLAGLVFGVITASYATAGYTILAVLLFGGAIGEAMLRRGL